MLSDNRAIWERLQASINKRSSRQLKIADRQLKIADAKPTYHYQAELTVHLSASWEEMATQSKQRCLPI